MDEIIDNYLIRSTTELLPVFEKVLKLIDSTSKQTLQETIKLGEEQLNEYINKKIQEALANEKKTEMLYDEINRSVTESLDLMLNYLERASVFTIPMEHFDVIVSQLKNILSVMNICKKYGYEIKYPQETLKKNKQMLLKYDLKSYPQSLRIAECLKKIIVSQEGRVIATQNG